MRLIKVSSRRARALGIGLASLALVSLGACGDDSAGGDGSGPLEVTIAGGGANSLPIFCYQTVGQDDQLGLFKEAGLTVNTVGLSGTSATLAALAAGQVDVANVAADPVAQLVSQGVKPNFKIAYVHGRRIHWEVTALPDSKYNQISDLKGAKIGVSSFGVSTYLGMQAMLKDVGIDPDKDVKFVAVGSGAESLAAMKSGEVDVMADTSQGTAAREVVGGEFKQIPLTPRVQEMFGLGIAMRSDLIQNHREQAIGFFRAILKGIIFMRENPEACARMHWKAFPDSKPKGVSDAEALEQTEHLIMRNSDTYTIASGEDPRWGYVPDTKYNAVLDLYGIKDVNLDEIRTNDLIDEINNFDIAAWTKYAKEYKVTP